MSLAHRVFAQNLRDLRASPATEVEALAEGLLARLLAHAARTVSFYMPLAPALDRAAARDRDAWAALPILQDADLRGLGTALLALEPGEHETAIEARPWPGLSTPIDGSFGELGDIADRAQWEFLARSADVKVGGRLAALLPDHALQPGDLAATFGTWSLEASSGSAWRWPARFPAEVTLEWLQDIRPTCLFASSETLDALLAIAPPDSLALDHVVLWRPARARGTGEACRRAFGARLVEAVSSDATGFAAGLSQDGRFVPGTETAFVEIVDSEGRPCPPGAPGRLLATGLYAYRRPVLRHDLGLLAAWENDPPDASRPGDRRAFRLMRPG